MANGAVAGLVIAVKVLKARKDTGIITNVFKGLCVLLVYPYRVACDLKMSFCQDKCIDCGELLL